MEALSLAHPEEQWTAEGVGWDGFSLVAARTETVDPRGRCHGCARGTTNGGWEARPALVSLQRRPSLHGGGLCLEQRASQGASRGPACPARCPAAASSSSRRRGITAGRSETEPARLGPECRELRPPRRYLLPPPAGTASAGSTAPRAACSLRARSCASAGPAGACTRWPSLRVRCLRARPRSPPAPVRLAKERTAGTRRPAGKYVSCRRKLKMNSVRRRRANQNGSSSSQGSQDNTSEVGQLSTG